MNTILQKRIEEAAHQYIQSDAVAPENMQLAFGDFINGAKFALQNQWISVDEEKPHGNIIIAKLSDKFCGGRGRFEILHFYQGDGLKLIHPQGYYDQCGENIPINAIEYWMPMSTLEGDER